MRKRYQVLLALLFLGFCTVLFNNWPKGSEQWASWVQAIGSIAAIGVAIWIPYDQSRSRSAELSQEKISRRKEYVDHQIAKLESAAQLVESLGHDIEIVCRAAQKSEKLGDITNFRRSRFLSRSIDAIQRIDLHDMPYAVIAQPTIELLHQARASIELMQYLQNPNALPDVAYPLSVDERLDAILKIVGEQLRYIDGLVRTFDGVSPGISVRHIS